MKKIITIAVVLLCAGTAFSQEKLLQWDQLMDRSLYPQREIRWFKFFPGTDKVYYYKDTAYYVFDGKKERPMNTKEEELFHSMELPLAEGEGIEMKEGDLYVEGKLVERGDGYNIVLGESVHRNEFGIDGGLFWSPNRNRLAFYRMDQSMVVGDPIVNTKAREAEVRNIK